MEESLGLSLILLVNFLYDFRQGMLSPSVSATMCAWAQNPNKASHRPKENTQWPRQSDKAPRP
jgi:hypothetical protein